jgi:hypothetical protein
VDREIRDHFLRSGRRIDRLELLFCSSVLFPCRLELDHWQPTAPRYFNAQQSRCCSNCLRLPLSIRADLIQINLLIIRLHLRCPRDELSAATARRTCSDRAPARKRTVATTRLSASERGQANGCGQQEQGSLYQNTCRYMQIRSHTHCTYLILTCTDMSVSHTNRNVYCTYPVRI